MSSLTCFAQRSFSEVGIRDPYIIIRFFVYILASKKNGTLYVGVANNLVKRVFEHKNDYVEGFTNKYKVHNLVYYEEYDDINIALIREKRLKKWKRVWKIQLIEKSNPNWEDLYLKII